MRKIRYFLLLGLLGSVFNGCNTDSVSSPAQPSFTVDKTVGLINNTQFTFTVNQVDADAITLFPYGTEDATKGGVLLQASDFTAGKATVAFTYAFTGTFNAVVVANKHSADGKTVKNSRSATTSVSLTSDQASMSTFTVTDNVTDTKNPATFTGTFVGNNISVTLPYSNRAAITTLVGNFSVSPFAPVTVGGVAQTSGTTVNNYTSLVDYLVTSQDGSASSTYHVTVSITPAETDNTLKSASGINISTAYKKKAMPGYVDNAAKRIVLYDVITASDFDSVRVAYATNGKFATGSLKQDSLLNLTSAGTLSITAEDGSAAAAYSILAVAAPKLDLAFNALNPPVTLSTTNFSISGDVLTGPGSPLPTYVSSIATTATVTLPAGVSLSGIKVNGATFNSGDPVDFSTAATFVLTVTDANHGGISYQITYTASVNIIK